MTDETQLPAPILPDDAEIAENRAAAFDKVVSYLNYLSHQIEDIAAVAGGMIKERRQRYNWVFKQNEPFLREHAIANLKRDKNTGEVKGKSYKTLGSGGGIFFRAKPAVSYVVAAQDFLELTYEGNPEEDRGIQKTVTYTVVSPEKLKSHFTDAEFQRFGVQFIEEDADPFHYCNVGSNKAWSSNKVKSLLTTAVDGVGNSDDDETPLLETKDEA